MWPFRRRSPRGGKHLRGARVTARSFVGPAAVRAVAPEPLPPQVLEVVAEPASEPSALPADVPVLVSEPRVELGFRDGSTAVLAPGSEQAKALSALASVLTQRD